MKIRTKEEKMMVYIVLDKYYDDTDILGVFSSAEKANVYIKYLDMITGIKYVIPMEIDKIDEEDDEWLEFNRDYIKYNDEKDI
jgi:hypothetical protein